jgi:hypothetical protein
VNVCLVYCRVYVLFIVGCTFCLLAPSAKKLATPLPVRRMFYQSADCEQCHRMHPRSRWRKLLYVVPRRWECSSTACFEYCSVPSMQYCKDVSPKLLRINLIFEICTLSGYYAGYGSNMLPRIWGNLSVPFSTASRRKPAIEPVSLYDRRRRKTWSGESFCTTWMLIAEVLWTMALCIVLSYFQCIRLTYPSQWQLICIRVAHSTCSCCLGRGTASALRFVSGISAISNAILLLLLNGMEDLRMHNFTCYYGLIRRGIFEMLLHTAEWGGPSVDGRSREV